MREAERAARLIGDGMSRQGYDVLVRAMADGPDDPDVLALLRDVLESQRKFKAALIPARRLIEIASQDGLQWDRLAGIYLCLDRFDEAWEAVQKAIDLNPEFPTHWHQAGLLAYRTGQLDRAEDYFASAAKLNPYGSNLKLDRAHAALALGKNLPLALELYETRWESLYHLSPWDLRLPEWKGEPIEGKRFLLHSEQGYGDAIMTARFARDLIARGASEVGLVVPDELMRLVDAQGWTGVRSLNYENLRAEDWDVQAPTFSALKHLGYRVDEIDASPYFAPPPVSVPSLPRANKLVGVCWASGVRNVDTGSRRHAPLDALMTTIGHLPGVRLVSLQLGEATEEIERGGYEAFLDRAVEKCEDFAATAALIDRLDAVVTVDTAVLHVAGAMGKPTFLINQYTRCWRWWKLPTGLPWYSSITSSSQPTPQDWLTPIEAATAWVEAL